MEIKSLSAASVREVLVPAARWEEPKAPPVGTFDQPRGPLGIRLGKR